MRFAFHNIRAVHIFFILGICLSFSISILSVTAEAENEIFAHTTEEVYVDLAYSDGVELVPLDEKVLTLLSTPAGIACGENSCLNKINDDGTYDCYGLQTGIFGAGTCTREKKRKRHWFHKHTYYKWTCTHTTAPIANENDANKKSVVVGWSRGSTKTLEKARSQAGEKFCPSDTTVFTYDDDDNGRGYYCASETYVPSVEQINIQITDESYTRPLEALRSCTIAYSEKDCSNTKEFNYVSTRAECQAKIDQALPSLACPEIKSKCTSISWIGTSGTCKQEVIVPPSIFDLDDDGQQDVWDIDNDWNQVETANIENPSIFEMEYEAGDDQIDEQYVIYIAGLDNTQLIPMGPNDPVIKEIVINDVPGSSIKDITWKFTVNPESITNDTVETHLLLPSAEYWANNLYNQTVVLGPDESIGNTSVFDLTQDTINFYNQVAFDPDGGFAEITANNIDNEFIAHTQYTINGVDYNVSLTTGYPTAEEALAAVSNAQITIDKLNAPLGNEIFAVDSLRREGNTFKFTVTLKES